MFLKKVVCSGVNENNSIKDTIAFLKQYLNVELGVQCSPKKMSFNSERFQWLETLVSTLDEQKISRRIALHLNEGFAVEFCDGSIPSEISSLLDKTSSIGRLQLNFKIGREVFANNSITPNLLKLKGAITNVSDHPVIISASQANLPLIFEMHHQKMKFDLLFDDSFGEGILPQVRQKPLFEDVFQGYAGGISPENVTEELEKISKVVNMPIFIDAEGKLKENGHFSFSKAEKYVQKAFSWNETMHQILTSKDRMDF